MDNDFNDFWNAYQPDNTFLNRRGATYRLWSQRSPAARKAILAAVQKVRPPKWKNPYFFVVDFPDPQPVFLRGDESGDIVQVRYNGAYKLCTRATMELFGLEWVRDW